MADDFGPGNSWGNPVGYIAEAQSLGWSQSETLRTFRADGSSMATQTFGKLWGQVADSTAREEMNSALNPYQMPPGENYSTWTMGKGGEFATSVNVFFKDRDTGEVGIQQYLYKTAEPHTPAEAEQQAWDEYSEPDAEDRYGKTALGTSTKNIYRTEAYGS